jgi:large subunit ribosomal protein L9
MKIILIEDVDTLGRRGTVVNVSDGYARNYLIPRKLALTATTGNMNFLENQKLTWAKQEAKLKEEAEILAKAVNEVAIEITKKVGEGDSLYGSVTTMEIGHDLAAQGFQIDRRKIKMDHPIKTLGEYTIPIKLHHDVTAHIKLVVKREGQAAEAAAAPAPPAAPEAE